MAQDGIIPPLTLKLSVAEGGLAAETGLTVKLFMWNWLIVSPTSHQIVRNLSFCGTLPLILP